MSGLTEKSSAFYGKLISWGSCLQSPLLFLIRAYWGWQFFLAGSGKLANMERTIGFFTKLGIPMPELNAYIAAYTETFGGLLLLVGLGSRLVSLPLAFTMLVAYMTADYEVVVNIFSDSKAFVKAAPFNYLLASLIVIAFGPGKISLDHLLKKFWFKK